MPDLSIEAGKLFVVATPIGNLGDIGDRASKTLATADWVLAEDTRHSGQLLAHLNIKARLKSLHEHNEAQRGAWVLEQLAAGADLALVSDAGTPLISDPGYTLVRAVRQAGYRVVPIPGPSAVLCALSAAGLPTDRFSFEGFLPSRQGARSNLLSTLKDDPRTLVFFESPQRIAATLADMTTIFGADRPAAIARELTKRFETIITDTVAGLLERVRADANQQRGEIVLLVQGNPSPNDPRDVLADRLLHELLRDLPVSQAVAITRRVTGARKKWLYDLALAEQGK